MVANTGRQPGLCKFAMGQLLWTLQVRHTDTAGCEATVGANTMTFSAAQKRSNASATAWKNERAYLHLVISLKNSDRPSLLALVISFCCLIVTLVLKPDASPSNGLVTSLSCGPLLAHCLKMQSYACVHMDMHRQRAQDEEQCETVMSWLPMSSHRWSPHLPQC